MKTISRRVLYSFPFLLILLVYVGDFHRDPYQTTPVFFGLLIAWALACRFLGVGEEARTENPGGGFWSRGEVGWWIRGAALVAGGLIYVLLSDRTYQHMQIYPEKTTGLWVAVGCVSALLALLVVRPPRPIVSLGILVLAGVVMRAAGLWQWEIDPARRDMLALVVSALDSFLDGQNPYGWHQMQIGSSVPLTYPPGMWLAHLPAHVAGLDIRWTGVIADGVVTGAIGWICIRKRVEFLGPVFLGLAAYLFLPDIHWNGIYAEPNLDWGVLALLCAAVISRRPLFVGVMMGLALTTRPFNLVLLPFCAVWLVRAFGLRIAWRSMLAAGLIAALAYVPFVLADPDRFYLGTVRWLLDYGDAHNRWFWAMMGASGQMYKLKLTDWMLPLQLGSVGVLLGLALWKLRTARGLLVFWALAYAFFVAFNSIIWMSFWIGVCIIAIAGSAAVGDRTPSGKPPSQPLFSGRRSILIGEVLATIVVLMSAGVLFYHLSTHFSEDGRDEVRVQLIEKVEKGDVVLDCSAFRHRILKAPFLLKASELPKGVVLASDPFTSRMPRRGRINPLVSSTVWVVDRYGLFRQHRQLYLGSGEVEGPYRLSSEDQYGRYTLYRLERKTGPVLKSFSGMMEDLEVVEGGSGGEKVARWKKDSWLFEGSRGWRRVRFETARFDRIKTRLIWAHPRPKAILSLGAKLGELQPRYITLVGGLRDKAAQWKRSAVLVKVAAGDRVLGHWIFENESGLHGASFQVPEGTTRLELEISCEDNARRHFLLDAHLSR